MNFFPEEQTSEHTPAEIGRMPVFGSGPLAALDTSYPDKPVRLTHSLGAAHLFELDALEKLVDRMPAADVEFNKGDLAVNQDPSATPGNDLTAAETVRTIATCGSWVVVKHIENDPDYAMLLRECLGAIGGVVARHTGPMLRREAFLFISSPKAVTPFHMDPEHNILLQLRGAKTIRVYPNDTAIVSDEQHERYHQPGAHRNLPHRPEFDASAKAFDLGPGQAVYVPVKAPHWVEVGDDLSVSLSVTWRSHRSENEARLRTVNRHLRKWGLSPHSPGISPTADAAKLRALAAVRRLKALRGKGRAPAA